MVSKKPKKQRKSLITMPLHMKAKKMSAHLDEKLQKELKKRSIKLRKNDKVKVLRGQFKGKEGKILSIDKSVFKVTIEKIVRKKSNGTEFNVLIAPSNLLVIDVDKTDKKRF
ncbi:MAG: 50S ribosomal protein L24 [Candidatus ainarchaeum sp.]|nr:50S ribosomal protein L24 [Candidatus ainarchaeum sp.]